MPYIEAINNQFTFFWLVFLVKLGHIPLLFILAGHESKQEVFLELYSARLRLFLLFQVVTHHGFQATATTGRIDHTIRLHTFLLLVYQLRSEIPTWPSSCSTTLYATIYDFLVFLKSNFKLFSNRFVHEYLFTHLQFI